VTLTIILSVLFSALFPLGYILGQRSANDAIQRERDLAIDLQAQNDGLLCRMLTMLDETIKGGQR
jgi:cell division protein FtsB